MLLLFSRCARVLPRAPGSSDSVTISPILTPIGTFTGSRTRHAPLLQVYQMKFFHFPFVSRQIFSKCVNRLLLEVVKMSLSLEKITIPCILETWAFSRSKNHRLNDMHSSSSCGPAGKGQLWASFLEPLLDLGLSSERRGHPSARTGLWSRLISGQASQNAPWDVGRGGWLLSGDHLSPQGVCLTRPHDSVTHSVHNDFLTTYCVAGTVLGSGDSAMSKIHAEFPLSWAWRRIIRVQGLSEKYPAM